MRTYYPYKLSRMLFYCLLISTLSVATFANAPTCGNGCTKADDVLKYIPGHVYEYDVESVLNVGLKSTETESDDTNLKLSAVARLFAENKCYYTLQLTDVKISSTSEHVDKKTLQSIQKPIKFTMNAGEVQPELCVEADDQVYALNIKRAIISLLQSKLDDTSNEVDVFGQCTTRTHIKEHATDGSKLITKLRNLNDCTYREQLRSGLMAGVVDAQAKVKSSQLLQADYSKETKIGKSSGIIEQVQLNEVYRFAGAAKGAPEVRAKITTNLKMLKQGVAAPPSVAGPQSASIIFEARGANQGVKNLVALKASLNEVVQQLTGHVQAKAANLFLELIRLMRSADSQTLLELSNVPQNNKEIARKAYLDALFRTGTPAAAYAIIKQLPKMQEREQVMAVIALKMVQSVDKATLEAAASLLGENMYKELYLAIGSLVKKYCESKKECAQDVQEIAQQYVQKLRQCRASTQEDEERMLAILKGFGNMQHVGEITIIVKALKDCFASGVPQRLRVAALQASASTASCDDSVRKSALALLKNTNEDAEIRIEAYLTAIECVNAEVANEVAEIVKDEPVQQVGGFIASNLRVLRDSTDMERERQRYHLANVRVTQRFPVNWKRYSANHEVSYKYAAMGLGASADVKMIYSQQPGFLPRSAKLDVNSELFGTYFHLLDVSLRQENLERFLEYYLGPKSKFSVEKALGHPRSRRSLASDTENYAKKYKNVASDNMNMDVSMKLFGSELIFLSLGDNIPQTFEELSQQTFNAFDMVRQKLRDLHFNTHTLFLDSELVYPTGAGVPLELVAQGFAASDLKVAADFDGLFPSENREAKFRLKIVPSVDADVQLRFGFHTPVVSTGVRVSTRIHSATGGDLHFSITHDGNGFNADFELPNDKLQLINLYAGTDFYVSDVLKPTTKSISFKESGIKGGDHGNGQPTTLCFNQLEETTGFDFCFITNIIDMDWGAVQSNAASKPWLLLRPISLDVYIRTPRKLQLAGELKKGAGLNRELQLKFGTPGSAKSHDNSMTLVLNTEKHLARMTFNNPSTRFLAEVGLRSDDKDMVAYANFEHNDKKGQSKIGFNKVGANEYHPVIEYQAMNGGITNDIAGYQARGRIIVQPAEETRYNIEQFEIVHKDNGERVLLVNGWTQLGRFGIKSDLQISPGTNTMYLVEENFSIKNNEYESSLFIRNANSRENVYGASLRGKLSKENVELELITKVRTWETVVDSKTNFNLKEDKLEKIDTKNNLQVKQKGLRVGGAKVNVQLEQDNKLKFETELNHGQNAASLVGNLAEHGKENYLVEMKAQLNKHAIELFAKCDLTDAGRYALDNKLSSSWGTEITLQGQVGQHFTVTDTFIDLKGNLQFSNKQKNSQQWQLKVIGQPDKSSADFRFTHDKNEVFKFNGEWQHSQDKTQNAKLHLLVAQLSEAKIDFKLAKNGKGEFSGTAELLSGEKQKVDVSGKFVAQPHTKFSLEMTMMLNGAQKLCYIKSDNTWDKTNKFNTNNVFEIDEKRFSFNAHAHQKGDREKNVEYDVGANLVLPAGVTYDALYKFKLLTNAKTGLQQGNIEYNLSEKQINGLQRKIVIHQNIEKLQWEKYILKLDTKGTFTNSQNKQLHSDLNINHVPKRDKFALTVNYKIHGDMYPETSEVVLNLDEYNGDEATGYFLAKHGDAAEFSISGNYDLSGKDNKPLSHTLDISLKGKTVASLHSTGKYQQPITAGVASLHLEEHFDLRFDALHEKYDITLKGDHSQGSYDVQIKSDALKDPLKLYGNYQRDTSASYSGNNALNVEFGDRKLKAILDMTYAVESLIMHCHISQNDLAVSGEQELDVEASWKPITEGNLLTAHMKHNNDKYKWQMKLYDGKQVGIAMTIEAPQLQPPLVFNLYGEQISDKHANMFLELRQFFDLDFKAKAEGEYREIDDFELQLQWVSHKLQLKDYVLSLVAKSGEKSLSFNLKNADEIICSGKANHAIKQEQYKTILEGQGQLQVRGKTQHANFRLVRQQHVPGTDKEVGESYSLNGQLGARQGVAIFKLTNREFNVKLSLCEEKKQCSNLQLQSIVALDDKSLLDQLRHSLLVLIDLRELGYPYEFELQSKTQRQGFKAQHSLDAKLISHNQHRYHLVANFAAAGNGKLTVTLPQREIVMALQQQMPTNGELLGKYEQSWTLWLDAKRQPQQMTRLTSGFDVQGTATGPKAAFNAHGLLKFEHPGMRTMSISTNVVANRAEQKLSTDLLLDVFRQPQQQAKFSQILQNNAAKDHKALALKFQQTVSVPAIHFKYAINAHTNVLVEPKWQYFSGADVSFNMAAKEDAKFDFSLDMDTEHFKLLTNAMQEPLMLISSDWSLPKNNVAKFNTEIQLMNAQPFYINGEVQPQLAKISFKRAQIIDVAASISFGDAMSVHASCYGDQLIEGRVSLAANNFLQTSYKNNHQQLSNCWDKMESMLQTETKETYKRIHDKLHTWKKDAKKHTEEIISQALPDIKPLTDDFTNNIKAVLKELEQDPMFKQITQLCHALYEALEKFFHSTQKILKEFFKNACDVMHDFYDKLHDIFQNTVLPLLENFARSASGILNVLRVEMMKFCIDTWDLLLKLLEKYGSALKPVGKMLHDVLNTWNSMTQELYKTLSNEMQTWANELKAIYKELGPEQWEQWCERIRAHIAEWNLSSHAVEYLNHFFDHLGMLPQTAESIEFLQKLREYLVSKLSAKPAGATSDINLTNIIELAIKAFKSLIAEISSHSGSSYVSSLNLRTYSMSDMFTHFLTNSFVPLNQLSSLLTLRVSFINWLLQEPLSSYTAWANDWQKALYALFMPFTLQGHIVNGQHLFTYDGVYVSYNAPCKYILAQDSLHNNFTIVAQQQNNKLRSITLINAQGETLELSDNGALKHNNAPVEFPVHGEDMHAWRLYYTISLHTQYGVSIMCTTDLHVCHISVNGFYSGRLRGVLGNGNAEPYDDHLMADGRIADNDAVFGNSYGIGGKCQGKPSAQDSVPRDEDCNELFAWDSSLALGFLVTDPGVYRSACDNAAHLDKENSAANTCDLALAYASASKLRGIDVFVPERCLKCSSPVNKINHSFNVKLPMNKADLVFVVDLDVSPALMHDFVAPLLADIRDALKSRSLTDVHVAVIAYNNSQQYPALLTSNNGQLNYKDNIADLKLTGPLKYRTNYHWLPFNKQLSLVVESLGPMAERQAYKLAFNYPYRAGATTSIVNIRSKDLTHLDSVRLFEAEILADLNNNEHGFLHIIAPIHEMSVEGIAKKKLLGFNSRLIATLDGKDPKKRSKLVFSKNVALQWALESGGWVFGTQNFESLNAQERKKALNQVSNTIADTIFKTEIQSECTCEAAYGIHAQYKCSTTSSTFVPNKKVTA